MKTTFCHCDSKNDALHPFPELVRVVIERFFEDTGGGFFSTGKYEDAELDFKVEEDGWKITDGEKLKKATVEYWEKYESLLECYYGKEVEEAYKAWKSA
jgi:hypothetical protein